MCYPEGLDPMQTANRPALIFDFGNVVAFFDYARIGAILGQGLGLSGHEFIDRARELGLSALLQQYESGRLTSEAFGRQVCELMGLDLAHSEFAAAWEDIFWLNEPVAQLVSDLKSRGYRLVMGSNTNAMHARFYLKQFAQALAPFDRLVLSHEVGHIKPRAEFYLACVEAAGVPAGECIFIDDLAENIEGARAAGLRGIVFTEIDSLVAELIREGIDLA